MNDTIVAKKKIFPGIPGAILLVLFVLLVSFLIATALSQVSISSDKNTDQKIIMGLTNTIAFGFAIVLAYLLTKRKFTEVFRLKPPVTIETISFIITAIGMSILLSELDNVFSLLLPKPKILLEIFGNIFAGDDVWTTAILLTVIAPITEELLFRGVIFDGFIRNYSVEVTFLVSAFLFGAIHLNPWQFISAFIIGIYMAWIIYKTDSIFQSIIIHAIFNGIPVFVLYFLKLEIVGYTTQPEFGEAQPLQPVWLDLLGILITSFGLVSTVYLFRKRSKSESLQTNLIS